MTADHIVRRNRANAAKSTGPRTRAGKAIVAGNARRHGATAKLDPDRVGLWLRIILGTPDLPADDGSAANEKSDLAMRLAEAEARYAVVEQARRDAALVEVFQLVLVHGTPNGPDALGQLTEDFKSLVVRSRSSELAKILGSALTQQAGDDGRGNWLLRRYYDAARSRRKKALGAWAVEIGSSGAGTTGIKSGSC